MSYATGYLSAPGKGPSHRRDGRPGHRPRGAAV